MSRSIIMGVVAVVIAALTATAYVVTTSSQEDRLQKDLRERVGRARNQLRQSATIEGLSVLRKIEALAATPRLLDALNARLPAAKPEEAKRDWNALKKQAELAFAEFLANEKERPDVLALVDEHGNVMHLHGVDVPIAGEFKDADGKVALPALAEALRRRIVISEIGRLPDIGLARIAAAPVIDLEASALASMAAGGGKEQTVIRGAVIAAYAITARAARERDDLLGTRVAYFDGGHVSATSFRRGNDEATEMHRAIDPALVESKLRARVVEGTDEVSPVTDLDVAGQRYLAAAVRLPRFSTKDLPADYPRQDAGALVLVSVGDEAAAFTRPVKTFLLLLGIGAMAIALFGMYLVHRRIEAQIDEVELGVAEIINGNLDRTFRPVGVELDGLANGLNVMLARLLGRPEPGEEAYDEQGNPIIPGKVDFEEAEEGAAPAPAPDPDLAALAQEPEPDYYKRLFTEYVAARKETGSPDDVSFESFIAKLRVNEGKLKAQYQCRAVRFRVVVKEGKVSLKPVPIY